MKSLFSLSFRGKLKSEGSFYENMEMKKKSVSREIIDCFRELAEEMDVQQITFQH